VSEQLLALQLVWRLLGTLMQTRTERDQAPKTLCVLLQEWTSWIVRFSVEVTAAVAECCSMMAGGTAIFD
jgi:hypothetical protein